MLVLDDGLYQQNPEPLQLGKLKISAANTLRIGDSVSNVSGVLLQDARGYRLVPTTTPVFNHTNPRPAKPAAKPVNALRVASFNVLNYFNGEGQPKPFPTRRGADTAAELERQQAKLIVALAALDADVIGLLEVENNGYSQKSALASLTAALNKVVKRPYRFIITERCVQRNTHSGIIGASSGEDVDKLNISSSDGAEVNIAEVEEVFTIGMNRAVEVLALKAARGPGRGAATAPARWPAPSTPGYSRPNHR